MLLAVLFVGGQHFRPPPLIQPQQLPGLAAVVSPLPLEILLSAQRGELHEVVEWFDSGGPVDALCSIRTRDGQTPTFGLLHTAAANNQLEMVKVLLKRGASVDLPTSHGVSALMAAAGFGHLPILLVLLQHSANLNLQCSLGYTAVTAAAREGREACVQTLLRAKANTELLTTNGRTALQYAEAEGHTAIATLIRQHAVRPPPSPAAYTALPAWVVLSTVVVLGAMLTLIFSRSLTAASGRCRAAPQRRLRRSAQYRAAAAGAEPSAAPPAAGPRPAASATEPTEAALQAAITGGGLSTLEAVAAAAAAVVAAAEADALEREMADGGKSGSSGAAGPLEASEVAVPDQYMCLITAEIMTNPVTTVRLSVCPRRPYFLSCKCTAPSTTSLPCGLP